MSEQERIQPLSWRSVELTGGLLLERQRTNNDVTIPIEFEQFEKTGRLGSVDMTWKPGDVPVPHHHWDSDIGKLIEAAAYSLAKYPNPAWEAKIDAIIDKIEAGQQPDGYFNTYYTVVEPGKRFSCLYYMHELYCAGHLIEGAVAYYEATGKRKLLDILCRYVDLIAATFGRGEGQLRGYDGHPEIELALMKLYRTTKNPKHLELCRFFIDERGRQPHYYDWETPRRDPKPRDQMARHDPDYLKSRGAYANYQAHKPPREQDEPVGHAVRAMYLYCGMTDLAAETGDTELMGACLRLWDSTVTRYMQITGGIGASRQGERFTYEYDLPGETTYNETCAAIGLGMWAHRLLNAHKDGRFADVLEQTLYNGVLSGISQSGDRFFYANYLAVYPPHFEHADCTVTDNMQATRQPWFATSCCPPNVARLLSSVGGYCYGSDDDGIYVHLHTAGRAIMRVGNTAVSLTIDTDYPWKGDVAVTLEPERPDAFALRLRIPGWSEVFGVTVNGQAPEYALEKGYLCIRRTWSAGDLVELCLSMPVRVMEAHPRARHQAGKVVLMRGPVVYCLEEADNGQNLQDIAIDPAAPVRERYDSAFCGGAVLLELEGVRRPLEGWQGTLYRPVREERESVKLTAVPYAMWQNRGFGEMTVWIHRQL